MNDFTFYNPTKLIFGEGKIGELGALIPSDARLMVTFGGGSVKTNGIYDQVKNALAGRDYVEFWGIEANPDIATLRRAIAMGKERSINFLLAVGGGSVIDGTKLIAAGICYEGDAWALVRRGVAHRSIPFATVLTMPATGSEMNAGAVISNRAENEKFALSIAHPVFSVLDPTVTFSLPDYQIACGIADTFVHVMEQYLTRTGESMLMDKWSESILQTLIHIAPLIRQNKRDKDLMSQYMLCATMALNGFISMGVTEDWSTHMIGHELTALKGLTHGQTLAVVLPGTMRILAKEKEGKLLQYATNVWGISIGLPHLRIRTAIERTENFFHSLGLKTRLDELDIGMDTVRAIGQRFEARKVAYGENRSVNGEVATRILMSCHPLDLEMGNNNEMKTVTLTYCENAIQAHELQDYLKAQGIDCVLSNEIMSTLLPVPGVGEVPVLVLEKDYARAKALQKELLPELD